MVRLFFRSPLRRVRVLVLLAALLVTTSLASAVPVPITPVQVGSGDKHAFVQIEWLDGGLVVFEVGFNDVNTTGLDLLNIIDAALGSDFTLDTTVFSFGTSIDGIGYDGHFNPGFDFVTFQFWNYWTRNNSVDPWIISDIGATDRVVLDGSWDGWLYTTFEERPPVQVQFVQNGDDGDDSASFTGVPEPATFFFATFAGLMLLARRGERAR